jgi:hypothetical protein
MSRALQLTGNDLVRALRNAVAPSIDRVARARAERIAARNGGDGATTRTLRRAEGRYVVTVTGDSPFAREFGALKAPPRPVIAPAVRGGRP